MEEKKYYTLECFVYSGVEREPCFDADFEAKFNTVEEAHEFAEANADRKAKCYPTIIERKSTNTLTSLLCEDAQGKQWLLRWRIIECRTLAE